jgi:hypothetical protein
VVTTGLATTAEPDVDDNPVPGLHVYVEAPLAVMLIEPPVQILGNAGLMVIVGAVLTTTSTVAVPEQPELAVPRTVYTMLAAGEAITDAVLVLLSPVDGDQVYDDAPLAARVTEEPAQIVAEDGFTATVGCASGRIGRQEFEL